MLSVHRLQAAFASRLWSPWNLNPSMSVRKIFINGGRSVTRQRSSLQPRKVNTTPENAPSTQGNPRIWGPFLFTIGFTGSCFSIATIWEYENMRQKALHFKSRASDWVYRQVQNPKHGNLRNQLNMWWNSLNEGEKMYYGIFLANATVFLAWKMGERMHNLQRFMVTYFCSNPFARAVCWPMIFSTFSHYSIIHFGMNMFVLHSFMNVVSNTMGKEQFLAFYLSAGAVSSLGSHLFKTLLRSPGLSLGASGAIMGVLAYFCTLNKDALLQVAFVPGFTFSADSGLKALLCFDAFGLLMRWRIFDHAAHLGGALFGMFWFHFGQGNLWNQRIGLLQIWHNYRTGPKPE